MLVKLCRIVTVVSCLQLAACAPTQAPPHSGSESLQATKPDFDYEERERRLLRMLLARAQAALHADQLMTPANDNAYGWYQQVLSHDSDNAEAHWGMRRIGTRYAELAEQAYIAGERYKAEVFLERGERVSLSSLQVRSIRQRYAVKELPAKELPANEFPLNGRSLSARNDVMIGQLAKIARLAQEQSSRLTIYARNDAEGRWIYKQMRAAVDGHRLRGNIQIGRTPRVVLIDIKG
jgi:hypothetical protein